MSMHYEKHLSQSAAVGIKNRLVSMVVLFYSVALQHLQVITTKRSCHDQNDLR